jgi:hypothetical protein
MIQMKLQTKTQIYTRRRLILEKEFLGVISNNQIKEFLMPKIPENLIR